MAYMDDSLWVAPTRSKLLQIVEKAESFYKFTRIRVNPTKSVLATNSTLIDKTIKLNNETIIAVKKDKLFKYLGAWFSLSCNPSKKQKIIITEARSSLNKLQYALITEKQAIYIINSVIIPRITYQLYSTFLSLSQLTSLTRSYTNIVKHKAKLSRRIPNFFLYHPEIYSLINLSQA